MQSAFEILKNNLDGWDNITETDEGASLAPNGYIAALVVSPGKLKQKRDFLSDLIKGNKRSGWISRSGSITPDGNKPCFEGRTEKRSAGL